LGKVQFFKQSSSVLKGSLKIKDLVWHSLFSEMNSDLLGQKLIIQVENSNREKHTHDEQPLLLQEVERSLHRTTD